MGPSTYIQYVRRPNSKDIAITLRPRYLPHNVVYTWAVKEFLDPVGCKQGLLSAGFRDALSCTPSWPKTPHGV